MVTTATPQTCMEQILRLAATRNYPDVAQPEGKAAMVEMLRHMQSLPEARLVAIVDELLRTSKFFPSIADVCDVDTRLSQEAATRDEWRPATDVCGLCGGTGWRRVSDNGCGVSVKCDHRAPDERIDAKQRASGEERA